MGRYISIGKFNKYYFLILGSIIVKLFNSFIIGFYPSLKPNEPLFLFVFTPKLLSYHPLIKNTFQYFGIGLGGIILELISYKNNKEDEKEILNESNRNPNNSNSNSFNTSRSNSNLIYNNIFLKNKKIYLRKIFFVFFSYYFSKISISSLDSLGFHQAKYWTLEFIALYYFTKKILKTKIYNHQIISLLITLIFTTLLYFINSFIPESNEECKDEDDECHFLNSNVYQEINEKINWFFIPIIIFIYLTAMILDAYSIVTNKWFMDIKYITIHKIISYIGIIGFVFSLILLFILSHISCANDKNFIDYICQIKDNKNNLYYDNFKLLKDIHADSKLYLEIFLLIPLFMITNFLNFFFDFLIIKHFDPFYLIPNESCYFIIYEIIDYFLSFSKTNILNNIRFVLAILSDLIGIIGCCVYFEIIELNFCNSAENTKRKINKGKNNYSQQEISPGENFFKIKTFNLFFEISKIKIYNTWALAIFIIFETLQLISYAFDDPYKSLWKIPESYINNFRGNKNCSFNEIF